MLLKLTNTYIDGRTKPFFLNSNNVKEIEVDDREGVPSKAVVYTMNDRKYWVAETVEAIEKQLSVGARD